MADASLKARPEGRGAHAAVFATGGGRMANIAGHFSASVVDGLGTEASTVAYFSVPEGTTLTALNAALDAWTIGVGSCLDAQVTKNSIRLTPGVTAGYTAPTGATFAASRVEQTAVLNLSNSVSPHRFGLALPGVSDSVISNGKLVIASGVVNTLIGILTAAVAGGNYTNNAQQNLVALIDAIISFRKRRKQLSRTSFEV